MNPEDYDFDTEAGCIAAAKAERARRLANLGEVSAERAIAFRDQLIEELRQAGVGNAGGLSLDDLENALRKIAD